MLKPKKNRKIRPLTIDEMDATKASVCLKLNRILAQKPKKPTYYELQKQLRYAQKRMQYLEAAEDTKRSRIKYLEQVNGHITDSNRILIQTLTNIHGGALRTIREIEKVVYVPRSSHPWPCRNERTGTYGLPL